MKFALSERLLREILYRIQVEYAIVYHLIMKRTNASGRTQTTFIFEQDVRSEDESVWL